MDRLVTLLCITGLAAAVGTSARPAAADETNSASGASVDCSDAYGGVPTSCRAAPCLGEYQDFRGVWAGQFMAYVRDLSQPGSPVFRPYADQVAYEGCLANPQAGETLIVGRRKDVYPAFHGLSAKQDNGLIVMGAKADGTRFLRTVGNGRLTEFVLVYSNRAADLVVWSAHVPANANSPQVTEMTITTIDARDLEVPSAHKRNVSVTMTLGPASQPLWSGLVAHGSHSRDH